MEELKEHNLENKFTSFKYRKAVHYALIISVIVLQLFLLLMLYNKFYNQPKLERLQEELHISEQVNQFNNLTKESYLDAQLNLQNYILTKDEVYLEQYNLSLKTLNKNLQNLVNAANESDLLALYLKRSDTDLTSFKKIESKFDSISNLKTPKVLEWDEYFLKKKKFDFSTIIDSISLEKNVMVDSVKKKGLFARVGDAISNKVEVQKEKENITLTLGQNNSAKDNLEYQFEQLFDKVNRHYQSEFKKYKQWYQKQLLVSKDEDNTFLEANKELLKYSNALLEKYNDVLLSFTNDTRINFDEQYRTNEKIKDITVIGLILFIVIISILLAVLTKISFGYENRLKLAKQTIKEHLNFKNRIVSMISHEIRAPLNIISIYTKGIRAQVDDEDVKDSLKTIEFTTNSLSLLANQILEFSKNENKKLNLQSKNFSLHQELEGIFKSLQSIVEENGNEWKVKNNLQKNIPNVFSDPVKIHQLFYNLVGNANKFTSGGIISAEIHSKYEHDETLRLFVKIKDTGSGIGEEDLEHIFEEYHQGTLSDKVSNLGVGLGLNLCRDIVELYQGTIQVESTKNVQTIVSFDLLLPIAK